MLFYIKNVPSPRSHNCNFILMGKSVLLIFWTLMYEPIKILHFADGLHSHIINNCFWPVDTGKLSSKTGTLARKRELRDMLEQQDEGYEDDAFEGTPFRSKKVSRKLQVFTCMTSCLLNFCQIFSVAFHNFSSKMNMHACPCTCILAVLVWGSTFLAIVNPSCISYSSTEYPQFILTTQLMLLTASMIKIAEHQAVEHRWTVCDQKARYPRENLKLTSWVQAYWTL
jgi:hypothetical protein